MNNCGLPQNSMY